MRGRRQIRIAHAEIDDVRPALRAPAPWPCSPLRTRKAASGGCGRNLPSLRPSRLRSACAWLVRKPSTDCPFQPAGIIPAGFYHGFVLAPVFCPASASFGRLFWPSSGGFFAGGRRWPSCRSRAFARSFSSLTCSFVGHGGSVRDPAACHARRDIDTASSGRAGASGRFAAHSVRRACWSIMRAGRTAAKSGGKTSGSQKSSTE